MHIKTNLSKKIISWYDNNKRVLPWRVHYNSPRKLYYRLLSEFMLQQTQVKTVIPYFKKFTKEIKTLKKLSSASERKVLKLWEGLGYYRRCRNLMATAKIVTKQKKSILPKTLDDIKKLPGIGDYTGNILLALVYNQPRIALDGGRDGLNASRKIILGASNGLAKGGWLILEHHYDQSKKITNLMKKIGMEEVSFEKDLSGINRYAICRKK